MKKMLSFVKTYGFLVLGLVLIAGVAYAAFEDRGRVLGSRFSVGSSDLKLLADLAGGTDSVNLEDEITGPNFDNIYPNWQSDYMVKIFNNGSSVVQLTTSANYETANDPDELRQVIFVEPFEWDDANGNGVVDTGEEGASLGRKTIVKWKTEGYSLGQLNQGEVKSLILRFSTDSIGSSKQGKTGIFDFEFDSIGQ